MKRTRVLVITPELLRDHTPEDIRRAQRRAAARQARRQRALVRELLGPARNKT